MLTEPVPQLLKKGEEKIKIKKGEDATSLLHMSRRGTMKK